MPDMVDVPSPAPETIEDKPAIVRQGSLGNIWNWGLGRQSPPHTPSASRDSSYAATASLEARACGFRANAPEEGVACPADHSRLSCVRGWCSMHNGSMHNGERLEADAMPWLVKLQFGQDKERPV